ncbi:MAG: hypothetical protein KY469_05475 [Actinobacteria bacterium]|nr:hypothetical protein [Actinomycetota bacterium]
MATTDTMRAYGPDSDTATPVPDFARALADIDALAATDPLLVHPDELPAGLKQLQALSNKLGTVRARWIAASETRNSNGAERHSKWLSG